jgi:hypothetical protein
MKWIRGIGCACSHQRRYELYHIFRGNGYRKVEAATERCSFYGWPGTGFCCEYHRHLYIGDESSKLRVAVLDFGVKKNILNCLVERGAYVKVYNAKTSFEELERFNPDGYFISNGPGILRQWIMLLQREKNTG